MARSINDMVYRVGVREEFTPSMRAIRAAGIKELQAAIHLQETELSIVEVEKQRVVCQLMFLERELRQKVADAAGNSPGGMSESDDRRASRSRVSGSITPASGKEERTRVGFAPLPGNGGDYSSREWIR